MRRLLIGAVTLVFVAGLGVAYVTWHSDELPPANAMRLSEIIKAIEDKGMKTITEVEFEDGAWTVEVHQVDGKELKLKVNPVTGEIR
jgi:hypothetical protein